jgi:prephenate dehydrogenase
MIQRLCVIGIGLMGGSIAKAARERGLCREIVGVDADPENLGRALELGVIDVGFEAKEGGGVSTGAGGADWVVIATPVGACLQIFDDLRPVWSADAIYTDVGSIKQNVIEAARQALGKLPANFVPVHPIAGAERSGVEAALVDLYQDKRVILTPTSATDPDAVRRVEDFWVALGARVSLMEPLHHDQVFAATSHLPHVLAYAFVHLLGNMGGQEEIFQYAGAGFRDFTRIASSNPLMWRDICLLNGEQIVPLLNSMGDELKRVASLMGQNSATSAEDLMRYFTEARSARQRFLAQSLQSSESS